MPQWQGKSRGTTLGYRIFVFICRRFGIYPAYFVLRFVAAYYFLFSWTSSGHIYRYFRRLGFGRVSSFFRIYRNYYTFGQTLLDKFMVVAGVDHNAFTYDFDGEDNLRAIVAQGRGGILLSGHVGNWESAGHLLRRLDTRVNVVMFDGEHQRIKQYLESETGGHNFRIIVIREDMSHVYAIGEALQKNELVCLHADRFLEGNKTLGLPFLGGEALFPQGPFQLAAGFRVPVSIVFAFKESARHYHFFGSPLHQRGSEPKEEFVEGLMRAFAGELEQKLRLYPEQWFNYYNFWYK